MGSLPIQEMDEKVINSFSNIQFLNLTKTLEFWHDICYDTYRG